MTADEAARVSLQRERVSRLVVYLWLFVVTLLVCLALLGLVRSNDHQRQNRVANVATWCSAINQGRDDGRRRALFAEQHNPSLAVAPYTLKDLDCGKLERKTARSGSSGLPW